MKITIEAATAEDLHNQIRNFFSIPQPQSADTAPEKKTRKAKESSPSPSTEAPANPALAAMEQSNAERKAEESPKPTYTDLSKAVMEAVKVHDKPPVLEILRTFAHKEGKELVVNAPADIAEGDYPAVITKMREKAAQPKAA